MRFFGRLGIHAFSPGIFMRGVSLVGWLFALIADVAVVFVLASPRAQSQHDFDVWYFGDGVGIDFRATPPRVDTNFALEQLEGTAVACDPDTGDLLFYTDGDSVLDKRHRVMPNGRGLFGHWSAAQSALIVPQPGSPGTFYIFTADQEGNEVGAPRGINYSVVDITLRGGLGDVTEKNHSLLRNGSERLRAVRVCGEDKYWIISHTLGTNEFVCWPITYSGLGVAVVSRAGLPLGSGPQLGVVVASHDGRRLAMTSRLDPRVELFDFDPSTGTVSGGIVIYTGPGLPYDAAFSPNDSKLYFGASETLYQCDVTGNATSIVQSLVQINSAATWDSNRKFFGLEEAPGNVIYVVANDIYSGGRLQPWLCAIQAPDEAGTMSQFRQNVLQIPGRRLKIGLPNTTVQPFGCSPPRARIHVAADTLCAGECVLPADTSVGNISRWEWTFDGGAPAIHRGRIPPAVCYTAPGLYRMQLVVTGPFGSDTAWASVVVAGCLDPFDAGEACPDFQRLVRIPVAWGGADDTILTVSCQSSTGMSCTADTALPLPVTADDTLLLPLRITWGPPGVHRGVVTMLTTSGRFYRFYVETRSRGEGEPFPRSSWLSAPPQLRARIGDVITIPFRLIATSPINVDTLRLVVRYDSTVLLPHLPLDPVSMRGTLLGSWAVRDSITRGRLDLTFIRGSSLPLPDSGILLRIPFYTFVAQGWTTSSMNSRITAMLLGVEMDCFDATGSECAIELDSICGLGLRLVDGGGPEGLVRFSVANPINFGTDIHIDLDQDREIVVEILDARGKRVDVVADCRLGAGAHRLYWNAAAIAPGVYFCRLRADDWVVVRQIRVLH